ncbi:hemerythrin domain-containing protein [Halalkalibacter flavus]|uniref:hemerythrin domain-containing protein n=1 Tax=Halalkalibacter flavus TaxID=3090668 RepID=UPI002FCBF654
MEHICGLAGNASIELCRPLRILKEEHKPLREQMEFLYNLSVSIEEENDIETMKEQLGSLRSGVVEFVSQLDPHSEKEEGVLFPMVAKYTGKDVGPIAVMEYEHDQAKSNLRTFLEKTFQLEAEVTINELIQMTQLYNEAFHILQGHFMKEEEILFPMAEQLLSNNEKQSLDIQINSK